MSCITRQSILKACYQLDQHKIPLRKINGKSVGDPRSVGARANLCAWWFDEFKELDTKTWDKVIVLMLQECKEYPDIDKLYELIDRAGALDAELETKAAVPAPKKKTSCAQGVNQKLSYMFALAKQGLWSEARRIVSNAQNLEENALRAYAKLHYPAKSSSDSWIEKNRLELLSLVRDQERCDSCMSLHRCQTKGYHAIGLIDKYGNIAIKYMECSKVVKKDEEVY